MNHDMEVKMSEYRKATTFSERADTDFNYR